MRRHFLTSLAAYLTGWVIAQSIFRRVWLYLQHEGDEEGMQAFADRVAYRIVDTTSVRAAPYPYTEGDTTVLAPEVFITDDVAVIRGENFYRAGCEVHDPFSP